MKKEDFLTIIKNLTPKQLNTIIEEKGKERKIITTMIRIKK